MSGNNKETIYPVRSRPTEGTATAALGRPASNGIYTVSELAKFLRVSQKTVREWCQEGLLPAFKIGKEWRMQVSDLHKLIQGKVAKSETKRRARLF